MVLTEGCRDEVTGRKRLLAVTYHNAVIVTENHLRFVIGPFGRHIACKRSVDVYKFRVQYIHVY